MVRRLALLVAVLGVAPALPAGTARVCELTLAKFVDGGHDLRLLLYHHDGAFYHGTALVPGRDNLPHRIDPTPAPPFRLVGPDGEEIRYPPKDGVYAYHTQEYRDLLQRYRDGEVAAETYDPPTPIRWDGETLAGTLDVWVLAPDTVNHWGLEPKPTIRAFRVTVEAEQEAGRGLAGTFQAWHYRRRDRTYGRDAERFRGSLAGRWRDDFWQPRPGTDYAPGRDWPCARGPHLNGSAVDCGVPLVESLDRARLLWVAEALLPGGKGGGPKVAFHYTPANWASQGDGAYGGPVVADGRVYLYLRYPDLAKLRGIPEARSHILTIRGAPLGRVAAEFAALMDLVVCFDARTGRTLWKRAFPLPGLKNPPTGKSGKGLTPCVYQGRVYARGHRGITCLRADTGEVLWQRRGRDEKDRSYTVGGGWSRDLSPVVIGHTLVFHVYPDTTLVGLDPDTGEELWRREKVCGWNAVPTKALLDGREYIVAAYGVDIRTQDTEDSERVVLIEPRAGRVLWEDRRAGKTGVAPAVWGRLVCLNVVPGLSGGEGKGVDDRMRAGCFRVSLRGAEKLWDSDIHYPPHRATPIAHRGHFYIDSRLTGFACLEAATSKVVGRHDHIYKLTGGDHNWTWHVATDGRVLTSGVLAFTTAEAGFRRLPGRLFLPLVSGYMCPVKPAIADGRLFVRTLDKLVCYDLRKPDASPR